MFSGGLELEVLNRAADGRILLRVQLTPEDLHSEEGKNGDTRWDFAGV